MSRARSEGEVVREGSPGSSSTMLPRSLAVRKSRDPESPRFLLPKSYEYQPRREDFYADTWVENNSSEEEKVSHAARRAGDNGERGLSNRRRKTHTFNGVVYRTKPSVTGGDEEEDESQYLQLIHVGTLPRQ